ncbi:MAG: prolyl oligopeptidase family serine peptidase, partial [Paludibacter sp.]|nr:prolyl oligopeptidase family serine peptidase [Paludibacter sp.]
MNKTAFGLMAFLFLFSMVAKSQSVSGDWKGTLSVQGINLELIFHISDKDGVYTSTMDVPAQGATGIPVEKTEFANNKLSISVPAAKIMFSGELTGDSIAGNFEQMGTKLPLTLRKFKSTLPGNTALVTSDEKLKQLAAFDAGNYKYKVADYFARPKASSFRLSPNGKYMSYLEKDDKNKNHVYVKEIATGKVTRAIEEKDELIKGYGWISDEKLYYMMDKGGNENFHIYATNIDGTNARDLTPFEGVRAGIIRVLKDQKNVLIIQMNKNNKQIFEPYRLNAATGEITQLFENKDAANSIQSYEFDKDGNLRAYTQLRNGVETEFYYKDPTTNEFKLMKKMNWDDSFGIISFNYKSANKDEAYVYSNLDSDKARIILYDFKADKKISEVFSNPDYDATSMHLSRKRNYEIDYFGYDGEKSEIIPVSKTYKDLDSRVKKQFPGKEYGVTGYDDDEKTFLIVLQSDKLYGTYYEYNTTTGKFKLLYDLMPQLKEADMAVMKPITFKSRDGLTIHGYITLPKEALAGKKVPMIVNPHGGPQGVRDSWGFNPEAQLFASRGYATLQVNFRISGGYGKEFLRAGFKQIGRKVMDDVEDGVKYAIAQGWVNENKIGIYGGSHGGYATLMGLVKTPDLYACGVNYVGVSNIETLFKSIPEYWKPQLKIMGEIWYDLDNPEELKIAREVSAVNNVDKIKKPLLVVQG